MQNPAHAIKHLEACIILATADCDSVLDLGCGIGDKLALCSCKYTEGLDVYQPYLDRAEKRWLNRFDKLQCAEASLFVREAEIKGSIWDAILLIDFLEHLERGIGEELLQSCKAITRRRVVLFCPEGDQPTEGDSFDMGGEHWQRHRSTWVFDDFKSRGFDTTRWVNYHNPEKHAIFAIWEQP